VHKPRERSGAAIVRETGGKQQKKGRGREEEAKGRFLSALQLPCEHCENQKPHKERGVKVEKKTQKEKGCFP